MTKVLVIEDEKAIRESIIDTLEFNDYEVFDYNNGKAGVEGAIKIKPDLILCDVMMPELDGYSVLLELSQIPETARIPFIFLSAKVTKEDVRKGMSLGADDYLTKPFTASDLMDAVQSRFERHARLEKYNLQHMEHMRQYINLTLPHELRTPLTGALTHMDLAAYYTEMGNIEKATDVLARGRKALKRLADLIEKFVAHSQLSLISNNSDVLDQIGQYSDMINIDEHIIGIMEEWALQYARLDDLKLQLESAHVNIFHDHVTRLFSVLADNAFKFSSEGSPVYITGTVQDNLYEVVISDQGRGMSEEQIMNIGLNKQFEREKYEQQGVGLGLLIAHQIVEIYDGSLHIESILGEKTTITVRLPLVM